MTLVAPEHVNDMIKSIESKVKNCGWLPAQHARNNFGQGMVGDHLVAVIVDAYMKGFKEFNVDLLYNAMRKKALELPNPPLELSAARAGLKYYKDLGYIPADRLPESVPNTLESAYDDWCIAQMARALGKEQDYKLFIKRASNYKNVFDQETGFMRPRLYNGSWLPLCQDEPDIITEGDHLYYSCFDPLWIGVRPPATLRRKPWILYSQTARCEPRGCESSQYLGFRRSKSQGFLQEFPRGRNSRSLRG